MSGLPESRAAVCICGEGQACSAEPCYGYPATSGSRDALFAERGNEIARLRKAYETLRGERDRLRNALGVIADSYPWEPYERGETIPNTNTPTNRRLAREALGVEDSPDYAWLLERGQAQNHEPTVYWSGDPEEGWGGWVENVWKAMRFPTKEAAEAVVRAKFTLRPSVPPTADVVQHGFDRGTL